MKPKEQVMAFIQREYENASRREDGDVISEIFDGMSTGTARIVIEQEIGPSLAEEFEIDSVANKGRYYLAKIIRPGGGIIQQLLVDKQTGNVKMVG